MSLREVRFDDNAPFSLVVEGVGTVTFEIAPKLGDLLISLAWPLPSYDKVTLITALEACPLEKSLEFPLQAGLYNDNLLLMVRRDPATLSAPELESAILRLVKIRDKILET
ncbi:MAG: hypothetical protein LBF58_01000 [Deltaproteobacteria bacterium]|nr:hypothetical protein [Deltaproteobacteria bacterium]